MMSAVLNQYREMRSVYVADSFQGFPAFTNQFDTPLNSHFSDDDLSFISCSVDEVRSNFESYGLFDSKVRFIEGWFADLSKHQIGPLSILRIDADLYQSTTEVLEHLYPKLQSGGYCIIDDYGAMFQCRKAVQDYRDKYNIIDQQIEIDWSGIYWIKS